MAEDYYQLLGVTKNASPSDIKGAYRKKALEWHPDRNKDPKAAEKFKEITKAYEILSDPKKKEVYDQYGADAFAPGSGFGGAGGQGGANSGRYGPFTYSYSTGGSGGNPFEGFDFGGFSDPFDIFEQFFGGGGFRPRKQHPVYSLTIDFMEAVKGTEKKVEIEGKKQTIKIPKGIDNETRIRFKDYDVLINVLSDSRFHREGYDIVTNAEISISQAALGDVLSITTIDGQVDFKIQPGTQSNTLVRLRGKGVPHVRGEGRGDHYIRVKVLIPEKLTNRQKELLREFDDEGKKKKGWF